MTDSPFRKTFKLCQALAYLPAHDIIEGFVTIENYRNYSAEELEFLHYLEKNYIGRLKDDKRINARFPICTWNLYDRILEFRPATNNPVESWHSALTADTETHGTMNVVLEELQLEQSKTESHILRLDSGEVYKKGSKNKELRIYNMVSNYKDYASISIFLNSMALNLGDV